MENKKPVILALDDQATILHTLVAELKSHYDIKAFTSGNAAFKFLDNWSVDLILLDYDMPGMNGYEVLKHLQNNEHTSKIPVIFLTGSENGNIEVEGLKNGASDYIHKPISAEVLRTRVQLQLELKRYQNQLEALVDEKTESLRQANEKLKKRENITLNLLAEVTDMRDHGTGCHIMRTTEMVRIIIAELLLNPTVGYELAPNEAEDIISSAKLHDLGKIAIPDNILLKPGQLTDDEIAIIKSHPLYGARLLEKYESEIGDDSFLHTARDIALYHHEKWDGSGYPFGIKADKIPLSARITALADVYDALTSSRSYKSALPHDEAVKIIANNSGTHFDPYIMSIFLLNEKRFEAIAQDDK